MTNTDINWNGFFDLKSIKDITILKQFFRDALFLSTKSRVDILKHWRREVFEEINCEGYIEKHISLNTHNVCIDRWIYNNFASWSIKEGEIGSSTFTDPSLFLFIYLDLEDLYTLVEKYNLEHLK